MEKNKAKKVYRTKIGVVTSDKMQKTRVVSVESLKTHKKYRKKFKVTKKYKVHDEENAYHLGDRVVIRETCPRSKDKRWIIIKKVEGGKEK